MLREERLHRIIEKLLQNQKVSSTELRQEFQVSEGTIRRDLNELEEKGLLKKVHGGAVHRPKAPRIFENRMSYVSDRKAALVQKGLSLIEDGQLIVIDGGSTNWHLIKALPLNLRATIFTNSLPIVQELLHFPEVEIQLLGGKIFKGSQVSIGWEVTRDIELIRPDLCFLGIRGIHPIVGITTLEKEEAQVKKVMAQVSERVIVLATKDKLGAVDHYKICDCKEVSRIITEDDVEEEILEEFREKGIAIIQ